MEYVFLFVFLVAVSMYLSDRKGWNATAKRLTTVVRANVEAGKAVKTLEKKTEKLELDKWTAEFEGKELDTGPKHVIVKTWFAKYGGSVSPHYKCKCGHTDWHVNIEAATRSSKEHVKEMNRAEELMKRNGGTHAW